MINDNNNVIERFTADVVLRLITDDVVFAKKFKEFAPQNVGEKVDSFRQNPNCTCRSVIAQYALSERNIVTTFVKNFLNENPQISTNFLGEIEESYRRTPVGGKIFRIPKNDQAFANFFNYSNEQKFEFKSFSITQDNDFWVIFFL